MKIKRLNSNMIPDLVELSHNEGFPYELTEETAKKYCIGTPQTEPSVQTYGVYDKRKLVAVMTATFLYVFPHNDNPKGRIVHISGTYTLPAYRGKGCATNLLKVIELDARNFRADYLCCDSFADDLYIRNGFKHSDDSRLWKVIE